MSLLLPLECAFESDGVTISTENVAGDSGGRTFAGLDEASHPDFPYNDPTPQAVVAAYEKEWNKLRSCELPPPLWPALFIQATNQGDQRCETMLQEAINDYGGKIVVDGQEITLKEGDMVFVEPGEKYFWDGALTLFMPCAPAWYPEQYQEVK